MCYSTKMREKQLNWAYILQKYRLVEKIVCYSRKKRESCPSHTKKGGKVVCTAQNRGESMNLLQFLPKWAQIMSFLPNHVPDITTSIVIFFIALLFGSHRVYERPLNELVFLIYTILNFWCNLKTFEYSVIEFRISSNS